MTGVSWRRPLGVSTAAALVAVVLVLGYLGLRGESVTPVLPAEKLRIALPVLPDAALVHVAAARGYLAEEGLDVSILPMSHGVAAIGAVLEGKADIAVAADVPFVILVTKGNPFAMVATLVSISNNNAIIARRDRAIATAHDLAGKKIGVTFGTSGSYFLWAFLVKHKVPPDQVALVDLAPGRLQGELENGSVDAIATWLPISSQAQAALGSNALSFTDPDTYRTTFAALGRTQFLQGRSGAIEKLVRALLKAEEFMRSHPDETLVLVAGWLKIDLAALRSTWKQFDFSVNLLQSQLVTLEDEARWAMARAYAPKGPIPNFLPHLYLDALLAVRPERVTVLR